MLVKLVQRDLLSCEAIVRRAPNNELIIAGQCGDVTEPAPLNRVYVWHSADDGNTWSKRILVHPEDGRAVYQTELTRIGDELFMFITLHDGGFCNFDCRIYKSVDSGYTWKDAGKVPFIDGFVFVRGGIKVGDNWLFPYQNYPISKHEDHILSQRKAKIWESQIEYVETGVLFADKNGNFYKRGNDIKLPLWKDGKKRWVWSEPTIAELSNGDLIMFMRVDGEGCLYKSLSNDGGLNWSEPEPTNIPNPSNKPKLIKMTNGDIALLNTPTKNTMANAGHSMNSRFPLEVWISSNDTKTWDYKKSLTTFPGWVSYPDGFIENDQLYVAFEFNRHDIYFIKTKLD